MACSGDGRKVCRTSFVDVALRWNVSCNSTSGLPRNRHDSGQAMPEETAMTHQLRHEASEHSLAALPQVTAATSAAHELRQIATVGLDRTIAVMAMTSGSIWLRNGADLICMACRPTRPGRLKPDPAVARVIESGHAEYGSAR